jgi:hypothetical protein
MVIAADLALSKRQIISLFLLQEKKAMILKKCMQ